MGYTDYTKAIIQTVIDYDGIKSVIDLGAQNDHSLPDFAMPYTSEWYKEKGISYDSIDINGENGARVIDLGKPFNMIIPFDLVVDAGTSEHVCTDGKFDWSAIYNCWLNKFNLCKIGGWIISENPKTGNWPGHGFNYYTKEFYKELQDNSDLQTMLLEEHAAMHNYTDGWNVVSVLRKTGHHFPDLETFKKFSIKKA